jgi:hypothetical protein
MVTAESGEVVSAAMYNSGRDLPASADRLNMTDVTFPPDLPWQGGAVSCRDLSTQDGHERHVRGPR